MGLYAAAALAGFVLMPAAAQVPPGSSREKEIALGKALAAEIERQSPLLTDPAVAGFLEQLARRLGNTAGLDLPLTARVLASQDASGAALPGGFLFVSAGIIRRAETEAELAGFVAHQIAHIAARHGTRTATPGSLVNVGSIPLIFMGGWMGICTRLSDSGLLPRSFRTAAQGFEQEADLLALGYLARARYDPSAALQVFRRLNRVGAEGISPEAEARLEEVMRDTPEYVVTTSAFEQVKERLPRFSKTVRPPSLYRN